MRFKTKGFTLIELLIVVAIIAILAAIAIPNFLEAQVRAKVSRVMSDQRTLALGNEAYHSDWNDYVIDIGGGSIYAKALRQLSTPIAYINEGWLEDPFGSVFAPSYMFDPGGGGDLYDTGKKGIYFYHNYDWPEKGKSIYPNGIRQFFPWWQLAWDHKYQITSAGPSRAHQHTICGLMADGNCGIKFTAAMCDGLDVYDPTNGTISKGQVQRTAFGPNKGQKQWPGGTQYDITQYLAREVTDVVGFN